MHSNASIDGKLNIVSSPTSGTEITVVVPAAFVYRKPTNSRIKWLKSKLEMLGRPLKRN